MVGIVCVGRVYAGYVEYNVSCFGCGHGIGKRAAFAYCKAYSVRIYGVAKFIGYLYFAYALVAVVGKGYCELLPFFTCRALRYADAYF